MIRFSTAFALPTTTVLAAGVQPVTAQSVTPAYVAVGDSYEYGNGDDLAADGFGYVPIVSNVLTGFYGQPVDTAKLGVPGATTREILAADCAHPNGAGYALIGTLEVAAFLAAQEGDAQSAGCGELTTTEASIVS